jgi:cell division protein FtsB
VRIGAVVAFTLLVVYSVRLAGQMVDTRRASQAEHQLATEVSDLEAEVVALETAAADAGSDTEVERWAREEQGWAQAGDQVFEPVPASQATAMAPKPTEQAGAENDGILERVRRFLSGAD